MKITRYWVKKWKPCLNGFNWFLTFFKYGVDSIDVLNLLMKQNKLYDANWMIVRCMTRKQYVSYAMYAASQVTPIYNSKYPDDDRFKKAMQAVEKYIKNSTNKNKNTAYAAAVALRDMYIATTNYAPAAVCYAIYAITYADVNYIISAVNFASSAANRATEAHKMRLKILKYGLKILKTSENDKQKV